MAALRSEQRRASSFVHGRDRWLLLADVGTGKTVVILNALQEWLKKGKINRAIIFAPKRVCLQVWPDEIKQWEHLNPKTFCAGIISGKSPAARKRMIENTKFKVLIANYEQMLWITKTFPRGLPGAGNKAIIFDEIDKMKSHTSQRWKGKTRRLLLSSELEKKRLGLNIIGYVARQDNENVIMQPGARHWIDNFLIRGGATGTPTPNYLHELWGQVYLIDKGERLCEDYQLFLGRFFYRRDTRYNPYATPVPISKEVLHNQISDIVFHMSHSPDMPKIIDLPARWVDLNPEHLNLYRKLEREALIQTEKGSIEAFAANVLWQKCRQLSSGFAYKTAEENKPREAIWLDDCKHKELKNIISELQGQQAIIVYEYQEQANRLSKEYPNMRHLNGRTRDSQATAIINTWNSGNLQLLGLHPKSAGHGLNLQKSQARHIIFITLPMSAGEYKQVVGRLARRGGAEHITVHKILSNETQDIEDLQRVEGKITTLEEFLAAMKARTQKKAG